MRKAPNYTFRKKKNTEFFWLSLNISFQKNNDNTYSIFEWNDKRKIIEKDIEFKNIADNTVIKIFIDEIKGWFLDPLVKLYPKREDITDWNPHPNEMIVLSICMMYPETIQQYIDWKKSNNASKDIFCKGFKILQNNVDEKLVEDFYKWVRCWLFHMASLNNNRYIRYDYSRQKQIPWIIIAKDWASKIIYLHNFIDAIIKHFNLYIEQIQQKKSMRESFLKIYKKEDLKKYFN